MRLTNRNRVELALLRYYMPPSLKDVPVSDEDTQAYFDYSDRGSNRKGVERRVADETRVVGWFLALGWMLLMVLLYRGPEE